MKGLLDVMTEEQIAQQPRDGWANVNDIPEVRAWLDTLPEDVFNQIEHIRQMSEQNGQMQMFNNFLVRMMSGEQ